ncbi:hypothetical protein ADL22_00265 [Streptomyces sp. NRRL F-4489]|uniref:hypothetical protein n=1 Tax=Streptomyces sp. NRRL F-4489 TaxID=1609095 RepID=UPI00074AC23B|nr:hypothetical protein [Streptomyces sp. NRRL F-4489]KUL55370.1 hypothetical protein ADL22_00265 [Streptomyces sp. NRRL F-4489]
MHSAPPVTPVTAAVRDLGIGPDTYGPTLDTARSTAATETVGKALAAALEPYRPQALAVWRTGDDMVLAHIAARELGAELLYASATAGILAFDRTPAPGRRVALLAAAWTEQGLSSLRTLAERTHGLDAVVAAAVVDTPALRAAGGLATLHLTADTRQEEPS